MFDLISQNRKGFLDNYFGNDFVRMLDTTKDITTDIQETQDGYVINMNIPGYSKDEIDISCKNEVLTVTATKESQNEEEKDGYIRQERYMGTRQRSFSLKGLDQESIDAQLDSGVLTIDIKKDEKYIEDKKIPIK